MAASYFLLLAQKKVTQEKGTLAVAVCRASLPGKLREQAPGFAGSTSLCSRRTRAHPARARATRGYFLRLLAAAERGPGRAERGSPCRRSVGYIRHVGFRFCFAFALGFPLSSGGGWTEKPRAQHAGGAMDRADSDNRPWMACGPNPSARSEPSAKLRARIRGRVLFGYFLLHEQEKVTGRHGWRPNHTRT